MNTYALLKTIHVLGVVIFLGNIIVTAWWKAMADRTGEPRIIAFAQQQVTRTDFVFTLGGVVLLAIGGYGMIPHGPWEFGTYWVFWGQLLLIATGVIWLGALIPVQFMQARCARGFADGSAIPARYWSLGRLWMVFGSLAVILPLIAVVLMVYKPM